MTYTRPIRGLSLKTIRKQVLGPVLYSPAQKIPYPKTTMNKKKADAPEYVESMKVGSVRWGIPVAVMKIAKAAGCDAFCGSRIKRPELEKWLAENPAASNEGEMAATEAELKRRKLQNEVTLGDVKIAIAKRDLVPLDEARSDGARWIAIVQEEAKNLMEIDHYRVFCERVKSRIGTMIP